MTPDKTFVTAAKDILKAAGYYTEKLWHADDVHFLCEQLEIPMLEPHEVQEVFAICGQLFDGDVGLNWPQLERALHVYNQRKQTLQECYSPQPASQSL